MVSWRAVLFFATGCTASVFQLSEIVSEATGLDSTKYTNYGCFCGAGNAGTNVTLDCSDGCCEVHDNCYGEVANENCNPYWAAYQFLVQPLVCLDIRGSCNRNVCDCDLTLATCLAKWKQSYRSTNVGVRNGVCRQLNTSRPNCNDSTGSISSITTPAATRPATRKHATSNPTAAGRTTVHLISIQETMAGPATTKHSTSAGSQHTASAHTEDPLQSRATSHYFTRIRYSSGFKGGLRPGTASSKDYERTLTCWGTPSFCRTFTLAELMMWLVIVTFFYAVGAVFFFFAGVASRKKPGFCTSIRWHLCCSAKWLFCRRPPYEPKQPLLPEL